MLRQIRKIILIFSSVGCISLAHAAGTFTPAIGTVITDSPVTITWDSVEPQQWVRVFNASDDTKIFDSGRQFSSGSVLVDIPSSTTEILIVFYERIAGTWTPQERTLSVDITNDGGGDMNEPVIVSDRITCTDFGGPQLGPAGTTDEVYEPFDFEKFDQLRLGVPIFECDLTCPSGEYLIATSCNASYKSSGDPSDPRTIPLITLFSQDASSGTCSLQGQTEGVRGYPDTALDFFETGLADFVWGYGLEASGACMSLPQ